MKIYQSYIFRMLSRVVDFSDVVTFYKPKTVLSAEDALQFRAIIRWGDGESILAMGRDTSFQNKDGNLVKELRGFLQNSSLNMIICLPPALVSQCPFRGKESRYRRMWALTASFIRLFFRRREIADAFMFRKEGNFAGLPHLLARVEAKSQILIVSSDPKDKKILQNCLKNNSEEKFINHVTVSRTNAYFERNSLLNKIKKLETPDITLLSAGPVGKCIVPDLLELWPETSQIIDTGNLFIHLSSEMREG